MIYIHQINIDYNQSRGFRSTEHTLEKIKSILFAVFKIKDPDETQAIANDKIKQDIQKLDALSKKSGKSNFKTIKMTEEQIKEFADLGYPDLKQFMKERGIK